MKIYLTLGMMLLMLVGHAQTFNQRYGGVANPENSVACRGSCILNDNIYMYAAEKNY